MSGVFKAQTHEHSWSNERKNANFLSNTVGNAYWFSYPDIMSENLGSWFSQVNSIIIEKP